MKLFLGVFFFVVLVGFVLLLSFVVFFMLQARHDDEPRRRMKADMTVARFQNEFDVDRARRQGLVIDDDQTSSVRIHNGKEKR